MAEPESETDAEKAGSNNSVRVGTRSDRKVVSANGMDTYSELSGEISVDVSHYEIGEMPENVKEYYLSYGSDFDTAWLNALKINKIKSRWIPAAESNGILFAPNEGYGLLTLAHILDQVLFVNLPGFSHLEGGNFAAVQKTQHRPLLHELHLLRRKYYRGRLTSLCLCKKLGKRDLKSIADLYKRRNGRDRKGLKSPSVQLTTKMRQATHLSGSLSHFSVGGHLHC